jgi:hypothetical protein
VVALLALLGAAVGPTDPRAIGRASGTDLVRARAYAGRILSDPMPASVSRVRVDVVGTHHVAGVVVSGVKFHHALDEAGFLAEIADIVKRGFEDPAIEEVDVWAVVPLDVGQGAVVSGDVAVATSRNVFTLTVPRAEAARVVALAHSRDAFWDPRFRASLAGKR